MEIPFRLVDVFTDRPLAGNQLCVVPDRIEGLTTELMQAVAGEIGFSETTFVEEAAGDRYAVRIFTPGAEMPFAGHPSLGTAFVLVAEGRVTSPVTQRVLAGEFLIEVDVGARRARMRQRPPEFGPNVLDLERVGHAVGLSEIELHPELKPQTVSTGLPHLIVPAADADAVVRARPDPDAIGALLEVVDADGLYLFAITGAGEAKARMFAPDVGVIEDPATGSAAGPLGAYLAHHGVGDMPGSLMIRQGEELGRPSELHVEIRNEADTFEVWVGGGVAVVGRGSYQL